MSRFVLIQALAANRCLGYPHGLGRVNLLEQFHVLVCYCLGILMISG